MIIFIAEKIFYVYYSLTQKKEFNDMKKSGKKTEVVLDETKKLLFKELNDKYNSLIEVIRKIPDNQFKQISTLFLDTGLIWTQKTIEMTNFIETENKVENK
jgi:hypothetical protein